MYTVPKPAIIIEEKKVETVPTETKSIWSNLAEVLKRPPREIRPEPAIETEVSKEANEANEEPPKLTVFDLIKAKKK